MSYSWGASGDPARTAGAPQLRAHGLLRSRSTGEAGYRPDGADPGPATTGPDARRLAAELAPMVDVWQRLLAQHVADGGGRCRTCTQGGTGLPVVRWPCSLHGIAELARHRHAERR